MRLGPQTGTDFTFALQSQGRESTGHIGKDGGEQLFTGPKLLGLLNGRRAVKNW